MVGFATRNVEASILPCFLCPTSTNTLSSLRLIDGDGQVLQHAGRWADYHEFSRLQDKKGETLENNKEKYVI